MQISQNSTNDTTVTLTVTGENDELQAIKQRLVQDRARSVKLQGFRTGKAPLSLVERSLDQNQLETDFLDQAINRLYGQAIDQQKLRPAGQPTISITKFVPFDTLEFTAELLVVGKITLPDYAKMKVSKQAVSVTDDQIDVVIEDLRKRLATRKNADRAAKKGDEATIDFSGSDTKTKINIDNASGKDYKLELGSDSFIPGFEDNVIGMKTGDEKDFVLTFPADYGASEMRNKKVTFSIRLTKLEEIVLPKADAAFAAEVGPFKTVAELRKDIHRELETQARQEAERKYENELLEAIANKTKVAIPDALIDEEAERMEQQDRQNVMYRGQTWQEHLADEGVSEDEHKAKNRPAAELRVKSGLVLGEIADKEKVSITPEDLEIRIQLLKGQYANDEKMQAELDKSENRRDIANRLLTEKTLDKLKSLQN